MGMIILLHHRLYYAIYTVLLFYVIHIVLVFLWLCFIMICTLYTRWYYKMKLLLVNISRKKTALRKIKLLQNSYNLLKVKIINNLVCIAYTKNLILCLPMYIILKVVFWKVVLVPDTDTKCFIMGIWNWDTTRKDILCINKWIQAS